MRPPRSRSSPTFAPNPWTTSTHCFASTTPASSLASSRSASTHGSTSTVATFSCGARLTPGTLTPGEVDREDPRGHHETVVEHQLAHGRAGLAPLVGGRAGVEGALTVGHLVPRDVGVAEDHEVGVGEPAPQPPGSRRPPTAAPGARARASGASGSPSLKAGSSAHPPGGRRPAARAPTDHPARRRRASQRPRPQPPRPPQ